METETSPQERLEKAGATQRDLARQMGASEGAVSRWLSGQRGMNTMTQRVMDDGLRRLAVKAGGGDHQRERQRDPAQPALPLRARSVHTEPPDLELFH